MTFSALLLKFAGFRQTFKKFGTISTEKRATFDRDRIVLPEKTTQKVDHERKYRHLPVAARILLGSLTIKL